MKGETMKKWFLEEFLPMWAKETVYADNRALARENRELRQENRELKAYLQGLRSGLRGAYRRLDRGAEQ